MLRSFHTAFSLLYLPQISLLIITTQQPHMSRKHIPFLEITNVGSFHPFVNHKGPQGKQRYSSTLFLTSALEGVEGSVSRPGCNLTPGKTRYSLYRRLGGLQGQSGQVRKISPLTGIRSPDRPARRQSLYRLRYPAHK